MKLDGFMPTCRKEQENQRIRHMNLKCRMLVVAALATAAASAIATVSAASSKTDIAFVRADEISAGQRYHDWRSEAPAYSPVRYRGLADPSFGPDGRPYPVPEYLRGQCYIDLGYGRFASCSNR